MALRQSIQKILMGLLIVPGILNSIELFNSQRYLEGSADETITQWEERFTRLKKQLPAKHGTVGYLADFDVPGIETSIADQEAEYILAQYTMAPVVLQRSTDHEWIIGNLSAEAYKTWLALHPGEYEITPFGNDLYLIHQRKP